jgi:hypothetical protein
LAHLILLTYFALQFSGKGVEADALLDPYSEAHSIGESGGKLNKIFLISSKSTTEMPVIKAPWFRAVVRYLLDSKADKSALESFLSENLFFDPKDISSFNCVFHSYVGMRMILDNLPNLAKTELQLVENTGQSKYIEYWVAKDMKMQLQR